MPVRSLSSSVLKWPDQATVDRSVRRWGELVSRQHKGILKIGYFGSYSRGDWGVGSDLDIIVIVKESPHPIERRAVFWDTSDIPVPVDLLIYTEREWNCIPEESRFYQIINREAVWIFIPQDI
ncbi:MAG: nucleotidyltransferase domain-containing protein [Methanothrix sp.]|nr:nucleotidyltransferase domain-containing protein [Methanothrix sp.]